MRLVRDFSIDTLAPSVVEKIIWRRISGSAFLLTSACSSGLLFV